MSYSSPDRKTQIKSWNNAFTGMTQYNINTDLGEAFSLAGKTPVFPITVPKVPPASGSPLLPASHTSGRQQ